MAITTAAGLDGGRFADRPVLDALSGALAALSGSQTQRMWALTEPEVSEAVRLLGALHASVEAHLVAAMTEAKSRSLGSGIGWGPVDWARALAPQLPLRTLTDAEVVATGAGEPRLAAVVQGAILAATEPGAVESAGGDGETLPVGKAAQIVRFHRSVRGLADAEALEQLTAALLDGARGQRGVGERELATFIVRGGQLLRPDREVENDAQVKAAHRSLTKSKGPVGLARYTWLLDEEGAAVVDAAVDALAKPKPDEDTGEHDQRSPETRRADALLDLVRRAVEAPEGTPRQPKTTVVVTVPLEVLEGRRRGAGLTPTGEVLTAGTVRRLSCDGQLVPVVLGTRGEVLDQGEAIRLFNRAQIRHLWLRDQHCSFPGCSKPSAWCDAHHLVHWTDGGPTDIWNAALLCRAHHSVVHSHRYAGRVTDGLHGPHVVWDLVTNSYDALLAEHRAGRLGRGGVATSCAGGPAARPPRP